MNSCRKTEDNSEDGDQSCDSEHISSDPLSTTASPPENSQSLDLPSKELPLGSTNRDDFHLSSLNSLDCTIEAAGNCENVELDLNESTDGPERRTIKLQTYCKKSSSSSSSSSTFRGRLTRQEAFDAGDEEDFGSDMPLDINNNIIVNYIDRPLEGHPLLHNLDSDYEALIERSRNQSIGSWMVM